MALADLWKATKEQLIEKQLQQIIAIAGDGKLTDDGDTSAELRQFLSIIPSEKLAEYAQQCLEDHFEGSGLALQDIVNQVGRRLGFNVADGRYRGKKDVPGQDGVWHLKNGRVIIVEVKTTDAYAIDLDTIAGYRKRLVQDQSLALENTSMLMIVGRKDTGGLEAQIRGSRYAWEMRIISVDALLALLKLKETLDDPKTASKISDILVPQEFTRVDGIIDLVFATAEEVSISDRDVLDEEDTESTGKTVKDKKFTPVNFHEKCAKRVEGELGMPLIKETRTVYRSPDSNLRILFSVSKAYTSGKTVAFWFAFHPHQRDLLTESNEAYIALGCSSEDEVILLPFSELDKHLDDTWITERDDRMYWHIRVQKSNDEYAWQLRKGKASVPLNKYLLSPGPSQTQRS